MTIKILRLPEVVDRTGLSRSTIYEMIKSDRFPKQTRIGVRAVGWKIEDIEGWINNLSR